MSWNFLFEKNEVFCARKRAGPRSPLPSWYLGISRWAVCLHYMGSRKLLPAAPVQVWDKTQLQGVDPALLCVPRPRVSCAVQLSTAIPAPQPLGLLDIPTGACSCPGRGSRESTDSIGLLPHRTKSKILPGGFREAGIVMVCSVWGLFGSFNLYSLKQDTAITVPLHFASTNKVSRDCPK